ncbi:MAG: HAD family hydrolase, partial [Acidaminobacteraceae bacterium]
FEESLSKEIEGMSYTETAEFFIDKFNLDYSLDEIKKIWYDMAKDYLEHKVKLKDGILELLELIKAENIPMGIGTSASKEFADIALRSNKIMHYFETIVTSCEVEKGKPFPYVFLEVAKRLGFDPSRCLVFEDTEAGVDAAISAGMDVVAVHDASSEDYKKIIMEKSTKYVYSVRELFEIEKSL